MRARPSGGTHSHVRSQPRPATCGRPPGTARTPATTYSVTMAVAAKNRPITQNSQPLRFAGRRSATIAPTVPHTSAKISSAPRNPHNVCAGVSRVAITIANASPAAVTVTTHIATAAHCRAVIARIRAESTTRRLSMRVVVMGGMVLRNRLDNVTGLPTVRYRYVVSSPASSLTIRLLGPLEISAAGRPVVVDTRKALAIVALIAAEGRPFARDELTAMFWPDADASPRAGHCDGRCRASGPRSTARACASSGRGWPSTRRPSTVDLAELERLASSPSRASLEAAAALARGPFLAGFALRDSPALRRLAGGEGGPGRTDRGRPARPARRRPSRRRRRARGDRGGASSCRARPARRGRPAPADRPARAVRGSRGRDPPVPVAGRPARSRARRRAAARDD